MADAPSTVPSGKNDPKSTVKWINAETSAMLNELAEHKATHMSGNGFKPQVWAKVVPKVIEANPDKSQQKDKSQCMNKLAYLKKIFTLYVFVCKYSGSGWDDEQKHATNTSDYIEEFTKTNGKDYGRCFTTPCPYWTELDALFDNMTNQATGDNVLHLHTKTRRNRKSKDTGTITPSALTSTSRAPLQSLANVLNTPGSADPSNLDDADITLVDADVGAAPAAAGAFDDELGSVPTSPVSKKRQRADTDDENDDGASGGRQKVKRSRSESGGKARRNAEAGTQISRALENFATVMAQPLVTSEDLSHVNEIVAILKDKTLLPDDPRGKLFRTVSKVLSQDPAQARLFILEDDRTRRIGMLEGILEDAGLLPES
ncbi:hypothetical protein B0H11DRAFT_1980370 [Mycena galericulata]|nr:hypothetical protein B0H11DRAFT_1997829 [Mycena galericulata]KAJ7504620.1 hypothetical protein B0H11DRAFT_1980370 [Mycena galericulata]